MKKREVKIYCPECQWEPQPISRWWCGLGGCLCSWNTFDTGGVCPDCGKVWEETACLACHRWSAHRTWYHEFVTETSEVGAEADAPLLPCSFWKRADLPPQASSNKVGMSLRAAP